MGKLFLVTFALFSCALLKAQSGPQAPATISQPGDPKAMERVALEFLQRNLQTENSEVRKQELARREAAFERVRFCDKANHFIELWASFAKEMNERQAFDAKLAKKLSKAFHDMEHSDGWPVREEK